MYLSTNFTADEATHSQTAARMGISNDPTIDIVDNIKVAAYALEQVRTLLDSKPILISSWYRSPALNAAVGGSQGSAHMFGWAIDFTCPTFGSVNQIIDRIRASGMNYDQVINEWNGHWCHISFDPQYRKMALRIDSTGTSAYA
jgi:zinc D-Ala-D-Ala carboxypeptidase